MRQLADAVVQGSANIAADKDKTAPEKPAAAEPPAEPPAEETAAKEAGTEAS